MEEEATFMPPYSMPANTVTTVDLHQLAVPGNRNFPKANQLITYLCYSPTALSKCEVKTRLLKLSFLKQELTMVYFWYQVQVNF